MIKNKCNGVGCDADAFLQRFYRALSNYWLDPSCRHRIDTLATFDTIPLRISEKKTGIFAERETVLQTVHSNPYYVSLGIQSITVRERPNAWNRWVKPALFFGAGVLIKSKL